MGNFTAVCYLMNKHADCWYSKAKQTGYGPVFTWGSVPPQHNNDSQSGFQRFSPAGCLSFQRGSHKLQHTLKRISRHAKVLHPNLFIEVVQNTFPEDFPRYSQNCLCPSHRPLCSHMCKHNSFFKLHVAPLPSDASDNICSPIVQYLGLLLSITMSLGKKQLHECECLKQKLNHKQNDCPHIPLHVYKYKHRHLEVNDVTEFTSILEWMCEWCFSGIKTAHFFNLLVKSFR